MTVHTHDPDSFAHGSVYQVRIRLPGGFILRSTPMLGEEAQGLMNTLAAQYESVGMSQLPSEEAEKQLRVDATFFRMHAEGIETSVMLSDGHFKKNAKESWENAAMLEKRAEFLSKK